MKEAYQAAIAIAQMNAEDQRDYIKTIENTGLFTEQEIESILITVGYFRLQLYPEMAKTMKREMAEIMYQQFND